MLNREETNASNLWLILPVSVSFGLVLARNDKSEKQRVNEGKKKEEPSPMPFQNLSKLKENTARHKSISRSSYPCDSSHPAIHSGSR